MKSKLVAFFIALFLGLVSCPSLFALDALRQDFDDVTVPALPNGWSSVSLAGSQSAQTVSTLFSSPPNSVLLPDPATASDTALLSPVYNFSTGAANYNLIVEFYHKRGMENGWDGGVLEISRNGGSFEDVTSAAVGGTFNHNGYNSAAPLFGSALAGRPAWTGISAAFESVNLEIPNMQSDQPFQLRFRIASDTSVSGPGWLIDSFELTPEIDLITEITPDASVLKAGQQAIFLVRVLNPSSLPVEPGAFYIMSYSGEAITGVTINSGAIQSFGDWFKYLALPEPIPAFGSAEFTVKMATSNPPRPSALLTIEQASDLEYVGAQAGFAFVSTSRALPLNEMTDLPVMLVGINLCTMPPGPPPAAAVGALIIAPSDGACPHGQAALVSQQVGAAAFAGYQLPPASTPFPSPYVEEPGTAGLQIPNMSSGFAPINMLGPVLGGSPGSTRVSMRGKNLPQRSTSVLGVMNLRSGEAKFGNNLAAASIEIYIDSDNDGSADDLDGCPSDAAKTSPGACGCNSPETDLNANSVPDCLITQDFRAELERLRKSVKQLQASKFIAQSSLRRAILKLQRQVTKSSSNAGIETAQPSVDLSGLGRALKSPIRRLVKEEQSFATNKVAALKAIKKIIAALA